VQAPWQQRSPWPHSALELQGQVGPQVLLATSQHWPAKQSESLQQPSVQLPLQHVPPLHCALVVQPQVAVLQVWSVVSQHWSARQSAVVQQPEMQAPLQQRSPFEHWLVLSHPQAAALQVCMEVSQHSPATQSAVVQQLPGMQYVSPPLVVDPF
jgi:hypothetical protein